LIFDPPFLVSARDAERLFPGFATSRRRFVVARLSPVAEARGDLKVWRYAGCDPFIESCL
jgi:hypothetical protein